MAWILLLFAAACFAVPFLTSSFALGVLCLFLSLLLALLGVLSLLSGRMQDNSRGELTPAELQALREHVKRGQAEPPAAPAAKNE